MSSPFSSFHHKRPIDNVAEGSSETREDREPANPLQTTSIPVIKVDVESSPSAETGLVAAVVIDQREGRDYADEQDASRTTAEIQAAPMPQNSSTAAPSVLIIEDSTELAEIIQATLEHLNMVTMHETHGTKALARFEETSPDVVLLDIGLPDMTGWKFLEALKEKKGKMLPVIIVITAYGDPANRLVGKFQNVHSYLVKPFTPSEVERIVKDALSTRTA